MLYKYRKRHTLKSYVSLNQNICSVFISLLIQDFLNVYSFLYQVFKSENTEIYDLAKPSMDQMDKVFGLEERGFRCSFLPQE